MRVTAGSRKALGLRLASTKGGMDHDKVKALARLRERPPPPQPLPQPPVPSAPVSTRRRPVSATSSNLPTALSASTSARRRSPVTEKSAVSDPKVSSQNNRTTSTNYIATKKTESDQQATSVPVKRTSQRMQNTDESKSTTTTAMSPSAPTAVLPPKILVSTPSGGTSPVSMGDSPKSQAEGSVVLTKSTEHQEERLRATEEKVEFQNPQTQEIIDLDDEGEQEEDQTTDDNNSPLTTAVPYPGISKTVPEAVAKTVNNRAEGGAIGSSTGRMDGNQRAVPMQDRHSVTMGSADLASASCNQVEQVEHYSGAGSTSSGDESVEFEPDSSSQQAQDQELMTTSAAEDLFSSTVSEVLASACRPNLSGAYGTMESGNNGGGGSYHCQPCHKSFPSSKMLQAHNQSMHLDKSFVCEICGKAFRFRSNLAEHRSVHTAVKPFVCKFCGKSSRLKGNLTKHILKHHKTEQKDYIGTDDIIIKKGKKSVKDPAAIDFLEKSMIVLDSDGMMPMNASDKQASSTSSMLGRNSNSDQQQQCFLLSLGLDGSIDLKGEAVDEDMDGSADEGSTVASGRDSCVSNRGHDITSSTNNITDQLLQRCNSAAMKMEFSESPAHDTIELDNEDDDYGIADSHHQPQQFSLSADALANLANQLSAAGSGNMSTPQLAPGSAALAAAACKALFFNNHGGGQKSGNIEVDSDLLAELASAFNAAQKAQQQNRGNNQGTPTTQIAAASTPTNFIVRKTIGSNGVSDSGNRLANDASPVSQSMSAGGGKLNSSKCPECGKQLRKARDLMAHMAMIHNIAPTSVNNQQAHSTPFSAAAVVSNELRSIKQIISEFKHGGPTMNTKIEQTLNSLDSRVGRMEKQLEMALNSIYTLVQLQTGINQQMSRLRDETADKLRTIIGALSPDNS
ncbi:zinc finger protein mnm-2 [Ditylenchus destructor]|uniref:Zinc finger protein mnm-2 n=1 Tax=Ditylenchus destructor TaxID=166010 RepID=A0AAD4NE23_9BILA|nr:zinc finger protein mnm-2 [Ditylenchus destructor]